MRCYIRPWLNWQMQDTTVQHLQDTTLHLIYILTLQWLVCYISLKTMYNSHKFIWLYRPGSTSLVCWYVARFGGMWGDCPCAGEGASISTLFLKYLRRDIEILTFSLGVKSYRRPSGNAMDMAVNAGSISYILHPNTGDSRDHLVLQRDHLWHIYAVPDMLVSSTNTISRPQLPLS